MALLESLLALSLLGGVLALEGTAVGQFMLSRPVAAGALTGLVLGIPGEGFALGALLEVYLLVAFPVGGARFPEGSVATVVGVASAATGTPGALAVGVAMALVWGQAAGLSITALRAVNGKVVVPADAPVDARRVTFGHALALLLEFSRGVAMTAVGVVVGRAVVSALGPHWPLGAGATRGVLVLGALVSVGVLLRSLGGVRRRLALLGAGLGAGLLMGVLL